MVELFLKNLITSDRSATTGASAKAPVEGYEIDFTNTKTNTTATKPEGLTPEGNVPMARTQKKEQMGLVIEKSAHKPEGFQQAKQTKPEQTPPSKDLEKTGDSVDERLSRYYPKAYKNASVEKKEALLDKYITQHYATLKDKPRAEQIKIQLADFKKLIHNTKQGDDYEMLASKINVLEKENQVIAAKNATVEQKSDELRYRGEIGVARSIHKTDNENQLELTKLITDSKNEKAITIGASHASELATENQTPAVGLYQKTGLNDEQQKSVDKVLINQYAQYAKENQVDIHKIMSSSKYTETVEYAASNIYNFDKSNQTDAFQVTMATKNEAAINAASAQYARYDDSVKNDIKTLVNNSEYKSAQATLTKAETEATSESQCKTTSTETKNETEEKSSTSSTSSAESNANNKTTEQKFTEIQTVLKNNDTNALKNNIKNLSPAEKVSLIKQYPNNPSIIKIMLESNPSLEVLSTISAMYQKDNKLIDNKILLPQIGFLNAKVQSSMIKEFAFKHDLTSVNRKDLNQNVKKEYDELNKLEEKDK